VDPRLVFVAGMWAAALLLSAVLGLDPWWSILGPENQGTGVLALGASAYLLCAGNALPDQLRQRVPRWVFWTGVVVSVVAVIGRFVDVGGETWSLGALSSTIGHRVFVGGFVAAAIVAALGMELGPRAYVGLLALGSGLAVSAARAAWVGLAVAVVVVLVRRRKRWRHVAAVVVPVTIAIGGWTAADPLLPTSADVGFSAAARFGQLGEGSASERIPVWRANIRAFADDPVLGSGPGTSWNGFLRRATPAELRRSTREYGDAHNLVVEMAATTGILGIATLTALFLVALVRLRGAPADRDWALGAVVVLTIVLGLQPLNIVLVPLLMLAFGMSLRSPLRASTSVSIRSAPLVLLLIALLLGTVRFVASSLERYGSTYDSVAALRWATRIEPWRTDAAIELAKLRAFDHREGKAGAADDAHRRAARIVDGHPWHPGVRLAASNVELLLDDHDAAKAWLDEQLTIFPHDPLALASRATLALQLEDLEAAESFARRALEIDPDLTQARGVLRAVDRLRDAEK
jgi:O-antigen ligase